MNHEFDTLQFALSLRERGIDSHFAESLSTIINNTKVRNLHAKYEIYAMLDERFEALLARYDRREQRMEQNGKELQATLQRIDDKFNAFRNEVLQMFAEQRRHIRWVTTTIITVFIAVSSLLGGIIHFTH